MPPDPGRRRQEKDALLKLERSLGSGLPALLLLLLLASGAAAQPAKLSLPDLEGEQRSLADLRGKWVVVNFWATWCPPCIEEIPELVLFHDRHKDKDAVVWGINFEEISKERLKAFLDDFLVSYPISRMAPAAISPLGPIMGLPTTFLVDPEGRLAAKHTGPVTADMLENYIEKQNNPR